MKKGSGSGELWRMCFSKKCYTVYRSMKKVLCHFAVCPQPATNEHFLQFSIVHSTHTSQAFNKKLQNAERFSKLYTHSATAPLPSIAISQSNILCFENNEIQFLFRNINPISL